MKMKYNITYSRWERLLSDQLLDLPQFQYSTDSTHWACLLLLNATIQPQQGQNDDVAKETTILNIQPMLLNAVFAVYTHFSGQKARAGHCVNKQNKNGNLRPTTTVKDI